MNQNFKDKLKNLKRKIRFFLIKTLVDLMRTRPASDVPKIKRLLLKIFPIVFRKQLRDASRLLPGEFAPNKEKILRQMTHNQVSTILEVFFYEKLINYHDDFIEVIGEQNLKDAYEKHGSFIILSAHFGNWEVMAYTLVKMGYKMNVIARPQAVNQMTEFMNSFRKDRGVNVIMKNNIIESIKALKRGEIAGIVSDLNAREWGYQVDFFGKKASFYSAPVILSVRGKSPLIPSFAERKPNGKLLLRFEKPIIWEKGEKIRDRVQKYVRSYEKAFRRRPDLWCWFHERYQHAELGRTE